MQPYNGPGEAGDQPLAVLNALVNEDKHRSLLAVKLAVPVVEFFNAFDIDALTQQEGNLSALIHNFREVTANHGSGRVVLIDPATNIWEFQMEVHAPTVQVVTNATPQREILDTLHELRVIVLQALDKLVGYLGDDQPPVTASISFRGLADLDQGALGIRPSED